MVQLTAVICGPLAGPLPTFCPCGTWSEGCIPIFYWMSEYLKHYSSCFCIFWPLLYQLLPGLCSSREGTTLLTSGYSGGYAGDIVQVSQGHKNYKSPMLFCEEFLAIIYSLKSYLTW